ncbi:MAG: hypothetical protein V4687_03015 [Bacteroidota bacterium]
MKKVALIAISLCFSTIVSGKGIRDTLAVYKAVITEIKANSDRKPFNVQISTHKFTSFMNFEFFVDLDYQGKAIRDKENWKKFVTQIDTSTVKDFKMVNNNKPWFGRMRPKRVDNLTFSPIIFNHDNSLALVNVSLWNKQSKTEIIYYVAKDQDGKWMIIHDWAHMYS